MGRIVLMIVAGVGWYFILCQFNALNKIAFHIGNSSVSWFLVLLLVGLCGIFASLGRGGR